jgi:hypothetical protein
MRTFISLLAMTAAVLAIPTAQAVGDPHVSLAVSSYDVSYGKQVGLSGRVQNHAAGVSVTILARAFNRSGFATVATATSRKGGWWKATARPGIATTYMAKVGTSTSRPLIVGVHPALTIQMLDAGGLRLHAKALRSFNHKVVQLQRWTGTGWTTILRSRLNARSSATVPVSALPKGTAKLRLAMSVNQAGVGYLGSFSSSTTLPSRWISLSLSKFEVPFGGSVSLSGMVSPKVGGTTLTILARPASKPEFQTLAILKTGAGGHWKFTTSPRIGTTFQAQTGTAASRMLTVGVRPTIHARILSGGRVWAHVGAGKSLRGEDVQVQRLVEGQWQTILKHALNRNNEAVFPVSSLPGGTSTLRIAMSVNQAGAGYLGGFSRTFVYQR